MSAPAWAATLYWDSDGSATGNSSASGAGLGGSGSWSSEATNWWASGAGAGQVWTEGSGALFWGTAGKVTATAVLVNSLVFKRDGFWIDSGQLTMVGSSPIFNVDTGVTAVISSTLVGSNTFVKLGLGTLVLSNIANLNTANSTAGGWRIEGGGTLRLLGDGSLGAPLPDIARNTVTDIQLNQSTIQAGASFDLDQNRRTKVNTNSSTNRGDGIIDTHGHMLRWFGSIQGGAGSIRVINSGGTPGILILGTDKKASINPFGSALPGGTVNLTIQDGAIVQTSGTVTPTGGELGSETGMGGAVLAIKLDDGQIRSESGGYTFQRNLILGPRGGSLDVGAWEQTFTGTISGPGRLSKEGSGLLVLDNSSGDWTGGTRIRNGILQLGRGGSYGLLPGTLGNPSMIGISNGASLKFNRGSSKSFFDIISGEGGVIVANGSAAKVRLVSNCTYTGPTTISSGVLMIGQGNPGEPGAIASRTVNNNGTLSFNRVEELTYAGSIGGTGAVEKQGAGKLVLTGAHQYTGPTTVLAGALVVNGVLSSSPVAVTSGVLGGTGLIQGPVVIQTAGRLSPGVSIGTLTVSNSLTLAGLTSMELNPATGASDQVRGLTSVAFGGTLALSTLGGALSATNSFRLFSATRYSGEFAAISPAKPGVGLLWNTNTLATDGILRISSSVNLDPVSISASVADRQFTIAWPSDHTGWRLQSRTNSVAGSQESGWIDLPNSTAVHQISFPFDPAVGAVFFRLIYP